jgi:uncharacterized protein (DUF58 family)
MLTADEARVLDRLTLGTRSAPPVSASSGVRRARARGVGGEFHEYRHYQPGDDPRAIDWTVEARLRQLVVRVSRAEGHLSLHVLVDTSASMSLGTPTKLECAKKIASALCYVAIEGREAAGVASFGNRIDSYVRPATGRAQLLRIFDTLSGASASGSSSIDRALEHYAAVSRGPGLVAVLSDYFDPGQGPTGLQALMYRGLTPVVVQIVAPEEIDPVITGEIELLDIEDASAPPIVVDAASVAAYRERVTQHTNSLRMLCLSHGLPFICIEASTSISAILAAFEEAGVFSV